MRLVYKCHHVSRERTAVKRLRKHGFDPMSVSTFDQGAKGAVIHAECAETDCVIKWSTGQRPRHNYLKEWYLQSTVLENTTVPTPETYVAEDPRDGEFYHIMEYIDHQKPDNRWHEGSFLPQVCEDGGTVITQLHEVDPDDIGGLPGESGNPMKAVADRFAHLPERIQGTPAAEYTDRVSELQGTHEQLFGSTGRTLIHADLMSENILFRTDGSIAGIIDWESAAYSDRLVDLAKFEVQICTSFSVFGPHDPDDLAETFRGSYDHSIDERRLLVLKILENLSLAAGIHKVGHFVPWKRIRHRADTSGTELHLERAGTLLHRFDAT